MKAPQYLLLGLTLWSALTACQPEPVVDPPAQSTEACKLQTHQYGNGNLRSYAYNAAGNLVGMTLEFHPANEAPQVYAYTFSYNTSNQITGATITQNGQTPGDLSPSGVVGDAVKFTWVNGRVVQVVDLLHGKAMLTTTLNYDIQGRIVNLKADSDPAWGNSFEKTFTYQPNGNFSYVYLNKETGIRDYYEETKVVKTIKHGESFLAAHGLPYDIFYAHPWFDYAYSEITGYDVDAAGNKKLVESIKASQLMTNSNQVLISSQIQSGGKTRTATYTIIDCK